MSDEQRTRFFVYMSILFIIGLTGVGTLAVRAYRDAQDVKEKIKVIERRVIVVEGESANRTRQLRNAKQATEADRRALRRFLAEAERATGDDTPDTSRPRPSTGTGSTNPRPETTSPTPTTPGPTGTTPAPTTPSPTTPGPTPITPVPPPCASVVCVNPKPPAGTSPVPVTPIPIVGPIVGPIVDPVVGGVVGVVSPILSPVTGIPGTTGVSVGVLRH